MTASVRRPNAGEPARPPVNPPLYSTVVCGPCVRVCVWSLVGVCGRCGRASVR